MASISHSPTPYKHTFSNLRSLKRQSCPCPPPLSPFPSRSSYLCRCSSSSSPDPSSGNPPSHWSDINNLFNSAIKKFDSFVNSRAKHASISETRNPRLNQDRDDSEDWDWDRWRNYFEEIDEQERLVSLLKSQLGNALRREDYVDAARIKVAIAAAATNDTVGRVMSRMDRAVVEERYQDAAYLRDNAGAGLVGWWSGVSNDVPDPYGLIIRITAEHGRYVARSFSPRQLATTAAAGVPLFEIYLAMDKKGEYKQQAVYLKRKEFHKNLSTVASKESSPASRLNPSGPAESKNDLFVVSTEDIEDDEETEDVSDPAEGLPGFRNILRDMVPGVKVKVLKVTTPAKVDKDFISKVIEQIIDEEDDEKDSDLESTDVEDEIKSESEQEIEEVELDVGRLDGIIDIGESEIALKFVVGDIAKKSSGVAAMKESLRVPAKLDKKGHKSFSFHIEKDVNQDHSAKDSPSVGNKAKRQRQNSMEHVMLDLTKLIGKDKIPLKVLKDVSELINLSMNQAKNRQPLSRSTTFRRIESSASTDPLNGLYIGAHGLYSTEVIQLERKFGPWKDDFETEPSNLEFYEYVEAVKLTGDPYVPAGQVGFRAKIGKRYQLPHKGIIPEEFGVIARYKGQGRLAEPGFRNPRWVDGELVILDGKYIKGGPVIGFVYWAPEQHFLVFFNRLRLP